MRQFCLNLNLPTTTYLRSIILKALLMLVLFTVSVFGLYSQTPLSRYQQITSTYGLPSDYVFDISFDEKGFAWLATTEGLVRYDGRNFRTYKDIDANDDEIDWYVRHLLIQDGKIWFTLNNGQLYYLNRNSLHIHHVSLEYLKLRQCRKYPFSFLREDSNGDIWLGFEFNGLLKLNPETGEEDFFDSSVFPALHNVSIHDMDEDDMGNLYIATNKGLMFLSASYQSLVFVGDKRLAHHQILYSKTNSVLVDLAGYVWLGMAGDGLVRFSPENEVVKKFEIEADHQHIDGCYINQLFLGQDNQLWFHSRGALSYLELDQPDFKIISYPRGQYYDLLSNKINRVVQSPKGSIWMATQGGGINVLHKDESRFLNIQFHPEFKQLFGLSIIDMIQEEGLICLSTLEYGAMIFNDDGSYQRALSRQINKDIGFNSGMKLYVDYQDQSFIIGNSNKLLFYDFDSKDMSIKKIISYGSISKKIPQVNNVYFENDHKIWLMTNMGAMLLENDNLSKSTFTRAPVSCMLKDYRGDIWLGTDGAGIYIIRNDVESIVHHQYKSDVNKTLVGNEISCMIEDNAGVMWLGTLDGGLCYYDRNFKNFIETKPEDANISNQYFSLIESDEDCIWSATSKGLYRINLSDGKWSHFGHQQGFPSSVPNKNAVYKSKSNNLLFGTESGLISFQPEEIILDDQFPDLEFTDFKIHNKSVFNENSPYIKEVFAGGEIVLEPRENDFAIEFVALSIDNIEHIHYKYRMIGLDNEWIYCQHNNYSSYMNLNSGSYVFEVTSTNSDGIWNPDIIQIQIVIEQEFYKQFWFQILIPIMVILIILLITYIRIRLVYRNNKLLELKVDMKTKQLEESNKKLLSEVEVRKTAEAIAESANKVKSEFLATLSHEIRSPMNSIIGYTDILSTVIKDEKQAHYLKSIRDSGRGLLVLINDILDLSKIEAGKLELDFKCIDIRHLIENILQIFSLKCDEKDLAFSAEIDPDIPKSLVLSEARLRQVLINIIDNAIKFTEEGSVKIFVKRIDNPTDSSKIDMKIEIVDTGIGIEEEQQKIIFNAFQQSEGQKYNKYGGTGLGLSISKSLIDLMGGSIGIASEFGVGSNCTLILKDVLISSENEKEKYESSLHQLNLLKYSILIVDDGKANRKIIKEMLRPTNAILMEAENGQKALEMVSKDMPSIIFMDIRMPVMNGLEAAKVLKTNPHSANVPLVAFTASISYNSTSIYRDAGFDDVLLKPVQMSELAEVLIHHLKIDAVKKTMIKESMTDYHDSSFENIRIIDLKAALEELHQLEDDWKTTKMNANINSVTEFSEKVKAIGDAYGIHSINGYHQRLADSIKSGDTQLMINELMLFNQLLEELEAYLND